MPPLLQLQKITGERGWRVGKKKCHCVVFLADQKIAVFVEKKAFWGIL